MGNTGFHVFDTAVQKTTNILAGIEKKFDWQERRVQSYSALRCTLHLLRDRLPVNIASNFASQLPLLLKGVFYDGWDPSKVPVKMDREEFLNKFQQCFNYDIDDDIDEVVKAVLKSIFEQIEEKTAEDLRTTLPEEFSDLF